MGQNIDPLQQKELIKRKLFRQINSINPSKNNEQIINMLKEMKPKRDEIYIKTAHNETVKQKSTEPAVESNKFTTIKAPTTYRTKKRKPKRSPNKICNAS